MWENAIEERTKANFKFKRLGQTKTNTLMKTNVIMSLWPPSWMVMIIYHYSQLISHLQNCGSIFQCSISYAPYKMSMMGEVKMDLQGDGWMVDKNFPFLITWKRHHSQIHIYIHWVCISIVMFSIINLDQTLEYNLQERVC
jgi:hypothetical protein